MVEYSDPGTATGWSSSVVKEPDCSTADTTIRLLKTFEPGVCVIIEAIDAVRDLTDCAV